MKLWILCFILPIILYNWTPAQGKPKLTCDVGQYIDGYDKDLKLRDDAKCVQCEEGTYNDTPGKTLIKCSNCRFPCNPKREIEKVTCTPQTNRECQCKEGYANQSSDPDRLRCVMTKTDLDSSVPPAVNRDNQTETLDLHVTTEEPNQGVAGADESNTTLERKLVTVICILGSLLALCAIVLIAVLIKKKVIPLLRKSQNVAGNISGDEKELRPSNEAPARSTSNGHVHENNQNLNGGDAAAVPLVPNNESQTESDPLVLNGNVTEHCAGPYQNGNLPGNVSETESFVPNHSSETELKHRMESCSESTRAEGVVSSPDNTGSNEHVQLHDNPDDSHTPSDRQHVILPTAHRITTASRSPHHSENVELGIGDIRNHRADKERNSSLTIPKSYAGSEGCSNNLEHEMHPNQSRRGARSLPSETPNTRLENATVLYADSSDSHNGSAKSYEGNHMLHRGPNTGEEHDRNISLHSNE